MEPFFFGDPGRRLFGAYHPPAHDARDTGVLICPPVGQEAIRSHRALLKLAEQLAQAGFPSLRFDYSGCGDSQGDLDAVSWDQWRHDTIGAGRELIGGTGASSIVLCGVRLGASLACAAAAELKAAAVVLWDPVISGAAYLEQLHAQHQEWLRGSFARNAAHLGADEILGFSWPPTLAEQVSAVDLQLHAAPAPRVLVLHASRTGNRGRSLAESWGATFVSHDAAPVWTKEKGADEFGGGMVAPAVAQSVVDWISGSS